MIRPEFPQPEYCLAASEFVDSDHPSIQEKARSLIRKGMTLNEKAVALFNFIRDDIRYSFYLKEDQND